MLNVNPLVPVSRIGGRHALLAHLPRRMRAGWGAGRGNGGFTGDYLFATVCTPCAKVRTLSEENLLLSLLNSPFGTMKETIRRGHDLFINTQQLRGKNVFNNMNCSSCHMGEGRLPFSSPVWPAAVILPNYRPKNDHVNSLEERIAGCFSYSMNGTPPEYGSDDMLALATYHQWLAKGVPIYQPGNTMYGRGYPRIPEPELTVDAMRGKAVYESQCAMCHGSDGAGVTARGDVVFPALWGDDSYNWGAEAPSRQHGVSPQAHVHASLPACYAQTTIPGSIAPWW